MDLKVHKLEGELADAIYDDMDGAALGGGRANDCCVAKYNRKQTTCDYSQNSLGISINHNRISKWKTKLARPSIELLDARSG